MNIFQEILDWASALPPWQSDAVRRFLVQDEFAREDEDAVLAMLKASRGLSEPGKEIPTPIPIKKTSAPSGPESPKVLLKEIHSLEHINALVPKQSIRFAQDGVTVIYGENGTGKSGYAQHDIEAKPFRFMKMSDGQRHALLIELCDAMARCYSETAPTILILDGGMGLLDPTYFERYIK